MRLRSSFLFLLVLAACSYRTEHRLEDLGDIFVSQELLTKISYGEVRDVVFKPSCIACHGDSGNVNLETFESTRPHLEEIRATSLNSRTMPKAPFANLNKTQLQYLAAWYQAGTPEFAKDPNPPRPPEVLKPTFASIKANIFVPKCIKCHNPDGNADRVPLETIEDLVKSPLEVVIPQNADESGLILVLLEGARGKMPPENSGISPVSASEIEIIKTWINNGAKD